MKRLQRVAIGLSAVALLASGFVLDHFISQINIQPSRNNNKFDGYVWNASEKRYEKTTSNETLELNIPEEYSYDPNTNKISSLENDEVISKKVAPGFYYDSTRDVAVKIKNFPVGR